MLELLFEKITPLQQQPPSDTASGDESENMLFRSGVAAGKKLFSYFVLAMYLNAETGWKQISWLFLVNLPRLTLNEVAQIQRKNFQEMKFPQNGSSDSMLKELKTCCSRLSLSCTAMVAHSIATFNANATCTTDAMRQATSGNPDPSISAIDNSSFDDTFCSSGTLYQPNAVGCNEANTTNIREGKLKACLNHGEMEALFRVVRKVYGFFEVEGQSTIANILCLNRPTFIIVTKMHKSLAGSMESAELTSLDNFCDARLAVDFSYVSRLTQSLFIFVLSR